MLHRLLPAASEANTGTKIVFTAQSHFTKCAFVCLLMSDQLHNAQPHPSHGQEAAVGHITWKQAPHHHISPTSFPSFVTLSCFSALYCKFSTVCIFNSVCIATGGVIQCQGQRWMMERIKVVNSEKINGLSCLFLKWRFTVHPPFSILSDSFGKLMRRLIPRNVRGLLFSRSSSLNEMLIENKGVG